MKKIVLMISMCLLGSQVQAEPNVYSYTYLPRGATTIETNPNADPEGDGYLKVELLDEGEQFQTISIFNKSKRDNYGYDNGFTISLPSLNSLYRTIRDPKGWMGLYARASETRDYTMLATQPDYRFTAIDSEQISANGSSNITKKIRFQVTGSGHVKIRIPYYMRTFERGLLEEENWDGSGRYINTIYGSLTKKNGSYSTTIGKGYNEQYTLHTRSFNPESGVYEVNVSSQFSANSSIDTPADTPDTNLLKINRRGDFILEGQVDDGIIEVELRLSTVAILDYSITLDKY